MDNTRENRRYFESSKDPQIKATSWNNSQSDEEVFWIVNLKELFDIDLNFKGIKNILNKAFMKAKEFVPYDTGITRKSMRQIQLDTYRIKIFFDKNRVIGQIRKGVKVKEYYVKYIAEHASRFNWLSICMYHYYITLFNEMKNLQKRKFNESGNTAGISLLMAAVFMEQIRAEYEAKKEEAKKLKEEEKLKKKLIQEKIDNMKNIREVGNG